MQKMLKRALSVAIAVSVLSGCASEEAVIHMAPLPVVQNTFTPKVDWSHQVGNGIGSYYSRLTPAVGYGKVFVADRDGLVEALDPATGKVLWQTNLEKKDVIAKLEGGITLAYGKLYIGTGNARVISLDAETGKVIWNAPAIGTVLSKPLVEQNLVVVNTSRGILEALDANDGTSKWTISSDVPSLTIRGNSSPVGISDGVFWGQPNGRLSGAIINSGQLIWQEQISVPKGATEMARLVDVNATPIAVGDILFAVGYNGNLEAINARSGDVIWKKPYSSINNMAFHNNVLFLVTAKGHIVAVNAETGQQLWENSQLQYRRVTAPTWIDGKLVVGDGEGYLHWLNPETGKLTAQEEINSSGFSIPPVVLQDGSYLVITRNGEVNKMQMP